MSGCASGLESHRRRRGGASGILGVEMAGLVRKVGLEVRLRTRVESSAGAEVVAVFAGSPAALVVCIRLEGDFAEEASLVDTDVFQSRSVVAYTAGLDLMAGSLADQ